MTECFKTYRKANEAVALSLWGDQGNPLDFIVKNGGSVRHTTKICERCRKKFMFYRKRNIVFDKKLNTFKDVCVDCINLKGDSF